MSEADEAVSTPTMVPTHLIDDANGVYLAPLQHAIDLGDATDADTASLTAWKQYWVAVNRVKEQSGFPTSIDWPVAPGQ